LQGPHIPVEIARWRVAKDRVRGRRRGDPSVYYVTDLDSCSLKRWFRIRLADELGDLGVLNARLLFGDVVHAGVLTVLKEIYGGRIKTELEGEDAVSAEKTVVVDGRRYTIAGRIDAILDDVVGIEVKSNTSPPDEPLPLPWHVTQAKAYNWLFNLQKTLLVYVTPHGIHQFEVSEPLREEEVREVIREEKSPRWSWECRYCEFSPLCHVPRLKKGSEGGGNAGFPR